MDGFWVGGGFLERFPLLVRCNIDNETNGYMSGYAIYHYALGSCGTS